MSSSVVLSQNKIHLCDTANRCGKKVLLNLRIETNIKMAQVRTCVVVISCSRVLLPPHVNLNLLFLTVTMQLKQTDICSD